MLVVAPNSWTFVNESKIPGYRKRFKKNSKFLIEFQLNLYELNCCSGLSQLIVNTLVPDDSSVKFCLIESGLTLCGLR